MNDHECIILVKREENTFQRKAPNSSELLELARLDKSWDMSQDKVN